MLPQSVSDHYRAQQRLIVAALWLTRGEWSAMDLDNLDASWAKIAPRINLLTASAQLGAATNGAAYVGAVLDEYGEDIGALGSVNPRAFAGVASDGRPLGSLLDGAVVRAKATNSLEAGGRWLDMAVHTQVADAGRGAASVAIASRPGVGWVRMVNPPSCGPCAVLAGKEFRYNQGFQRHPRCDCVHVPTTLANPFDHDGVSPRLDQITDLTEGERKALLEGSDLSRVINARRGGGLGKMSTTELAKRGKVRLTPDGIFATAKDRTEALRLLKANGYITPTARRVAVSTPKPPVVTAAPKPTFDPKWREGRDVHVVKSDLADAETKAARWAKEVAEREAEIARLEKLIADRKIELREVYGVPSRSVLKTIKQEGPYQQWTRELEMWRERLPAYKQGLDDAARELERLRAVQNLPDFDPENPPKFYGDRVKFYTPSPEAVTYATELELLPKGAHQLLRDHFAEVDGSGFHLGIDGKLSKLDAFKDAGQARGYAKGKTTDDAAGAYSPRERVVGCTNSHAHGSSSMALHEGSHALDDALLRSRGGSASLSDEFKEAWQGVSDTYTPHAYFRRDGNPDGWWSEAFAESYASYTLQRAALSGDELARAVVTSLGQGSELGPKGLAAARNLVRYFEQLEAAMA